MHSSCSDDVGSSGGGGMSSVEGGQVLVSIAALVTEGRIPSGNDHQDNPSGRANVGKSPRGFSEGPHCTFSRASKGHQCHQDNQLCIKYEKIQSYVLSLWQKNIPLCIQVLLIPKCCCVTDLLCNTTTNIEEIGSALLLEEWHINVIHRRNHDLSNLNVNQLINAIRSQLYFSQITAWLASPDEKIRKSFPNNSVVYCLTVPGETYGCAKFSTIAQKHNFPLADIGNGIVLKVCLSNLPRSEEIPNVKCSKCSVPMPSTEKTNVCLLDDRMQTSCTLKGKHRCEEYDEFDNCCNNTTRLKHLAAVKNLNQPTCNPLKIPDNLNLSAPSTSRMIFNNISNSCASGYGITQPGSSKAKFEKRAEERKMEQQSDGCNVDLELSKKEFNEVLNVLRQTGPAKPKNNDLLNKQSKGDILLDAILRSSKAQSANAMKPPQEGSTLSAYRMQTEENQNSTTTGIFLERNKRKCVHKSVVNQLGSSNACMDRHRECDNSSICDKKKDSLNSDNNIRVGGNDIYIDINCDTVKRKKTDYYKMRDISNVFSLEYLEKRQKVKVKQKISFDEEPYENKRNNKNGSNYQKSNEESLEEKCNKNSHPCIEVPSASDQAKFRKNLDSAASMVFHSRTGLPLTSSPAPVRRGKNCFDFDSSINSVSAIRSALFSLAPSCSTDEDSESDCSIVSPCSPDAINNLKQCKIPLYKYHRRGQTAGLLGSFEESVLNGRLEPVSTVHGFTAELGASGSFCPRHVVLPVTVFFYTLGDNDKVSTPYLGHINLGKKGYNVPKSGTIQVTLFNPLGTVVKMFVIMYDLSDMPTNSQTFIRQRTLYMPANYEDKNIQWSQKWLRYLVHLRFMSSKSGRIYLHSDIRMIICRKSDLDTATAHGIDMSYELRSFTHSPNNPKFSPRK